MYELPRRRFLVGLGSAAACGAVLALRQPGSMGDSRVDGSGSASDRPATLEAPWQMVRRRSRALGARVTLTALHRDPSRAHQALDAAFAELELVEQLLSIYRPTSQLSQLNRNGSLAAPHPYLVSVLHYARRMSQRTGGAFDVTVQSLWRAHAAARRAGREPTDRERTEARRRVDWRRVECGADRVRLRGSGTQVTLNGIAQGFAADRVAATLRAHGVQHALIDTGEIQARGNRPPDETWRVGIRHPGDPRAFLSLAELTDRGLATSSNESPALPGREHSHLFDPRDGRCPTHWSSVSVVARTAMAADALSTALFVMDRDAGVRLIKETEDADALLLDRNGEATTTPGFPLADQG